MKCVCSRVFELSLQILPSTGLADSQCVATANSWNQKERAFFIKLRSRPQMPDRTHRCTSWAKLVKNMVRSAIIWRSNFCPQHWNSCHLGWYLCEFDLVDLEERETTRVKGKVQRQKASVSAKMMTCIEGYSLSTSIVMRLRHWFSGRAQRFISRYPGFRSFTDLSQNNISFFL